MADAHVRVSLLDDDRIRDIVREEIAEHERRRALGALTLRGTGLTPDELLRLMSRNNEQLVKDLQRPAAPVPRARLSPLARVRVWLRRWRRS
jgi:hypothetical protein